MKAVFSIFVGFSLAINSLESQFNSSGRLGSVKTRDVTRFEMGKPFFLKTAHKWVVQYSYTVY